MSRDRFRGRSGRTLLEVVAALLVLGAVAGAAAAAVTMLARVNRAAGDSAETMSARRTLLAVLGWELRPTVLSRDVLALDRDSVALRAFRGQAVVCAAGPPAVVRYRGLRAPDPSKDSLLLLTAPFGEPVSPLTASALAAAVACPPAVGEQVYRLSTPAGLRQGDVALLFEHGVYHFAGGALRYRRGAGGRQPVTSDLFFDDSSGFAISAFKHAGMASADTVAIAVAAAFRTVGRSGGAGATPTFRTRLAIRNALLPLDSLVQ